MEVRYEIDHHLKILAVCPTDTHSLLLRDVLLRPADDVFSVIVAFEGYYLCQQIYREIKQSADLVTKFTAAMSQVPAVSQIY